MDDSSGRSSVIWAVTIITAITVVAAVVFVTTGAFSAERSVLLMTALFGFAGPLIASLVALLDVGETQKRVEHVNRKVDELTKGDTADTNDGGDGQ